MSLPPPTGGGPDPLQDPAILLAMWLPPEPLPGPAPSDVPFLPAQGGGGVAAWFGGTLGAMGIAALAAAPELPFGRAAELGLLAAIGLGLGGLLLSQVLRSRRGSGLSAAAAALVHAMVAFAAAAGAVGPALLLLTLAVGIGLGMLPRSWASLVVMAMTAAATVVLWSHALPALVVGPSLGLAVAGGLLAVAWLGRAGALPDLPLPVARRAGGRHWLAVGLAGAAVAMASWLLAPTLLVANAASTPELAARGGAVLVLALLWGGLAAGLVRFAFVLAVGAAAATWWLPGGSSLPAGVVPLAHHGAARVSYDRSTQELQLHQHGRCVARQGPDRDLGGLLAAMVTAWSQPGDRWLVLGTGTGGWLEPLLDGERLVLDVVETRPAAAPLRGWFRGVGPVPPQAERAATAVAAAQVEGLTTALQRRLPASRQGIVLGDEITAVASTVTTLAFQRELRQVAGAGLVLQAAGMQDTPAGVLQAWFAAAIEAHPWNQVHVVGDLLVLASAVAPPTTAADAEQWPAARRWLLHRARLGSLRDLELAARGTLRQPTAGVWLEAASTGRAATIEVLHGWLRPGPAPSPADLANSVLLRWQAATASLAADVAQLATLAAGPDAVAAAHAVAMRWLPVGAPHAVLQASLGLAGADGVALLAPALASRRAHALDPTWMARAPALWRGLPQVEIPASPLEDLAALPAPARLSELAVGDEPFAVALRARFPSPCAEALVAALAGGPLPDAAVLALRQLADPFVLAEAARAVGPRGGERELLGLWRHDLPLPVAVTKLLRGDPAARRSLAGALCGRREPSTHEALAQLLVDEEAEVRQLAGDALWHAVGEQVPYHPEWPQSARQQAAERLRALHNRAP